MAKKVYLKFDFDARVNDEIVYSPGIHELEEGPSANRWIHRGAVEVSAEDYKKSKKPADKVVEHKKQEPKKEEPKVEAPKLDEKKVEVSGEDAKVEAPNKEENDL